MPADLEPADVVPAADPPPPAAPRHAAPPPAAAAPAPGAVPEGAEGGEESGEGRVVLGFADESTIDLSADDPRARALQELTGSLISGTDPERRPPPS